MPMNGADSNLLLGEQNKLFGELNQSASQTHFSPGFCDSKSAAGQIHAKPAEPATTTRSTPQARRYHSSQAAGAAAVSNRQKVGSVKHSSNNIHRTGVNNGSYQNNSNLDEGPSEAKRVKGVGDHSQRDEEDEPNLRSYYSDGDFSEVLIRINQDNESGDEQGAASAGAGAEAVSNLCGDGANEGSAASGVAPKRSKCGGSDSKSRLSRLLGDSTNSNKATGVASSDRRRSSCSDADDAVVTGKASLDISSNKCE